LYDYKFLWDNLSIYKRLTADIIHCLVIVRMLIGREYSLTTRAVNDSR